MFVSVVIIVSYHLTGSQVRYRRLAGERRGVARRNVALCLVPLYGAIYLKEKNVEIFNSLDQRTL